MRLAALVALVAVVAAGCGSSPRKSASQPSSTTTSQTGLRIGLIAPFALHVPGAVMERGSLDQVATDALVIVAAGTGAVPRLSAVAAAHPSTHFVLAGASALALRLPNVAGLVIRDDQAARLAGVVAGLVGSDGGTPQPRVAWVGPTDAVLLQAFTRGVRELDPHAQVLRGTSPDRPAACKEAALGAIARGAVAIFAGRGLCADAAVDGAHDQNVVALRLSDFELPQVAAAQAARDAVAGVYHGGQDVIFGEQSGAIGVAQLDPRISPTTAVRARTAAQQLASGLPPSG